MLATRERRKVAESSQVPGTSAGLVWVASGNWARLSHQHTLPGTLARTSVSGMFCICFLAVPSVRIFIASGECLRISTAGFFKKFLEPGDNVFIQHTDSNFENCNLSTIM